MSDQHVHLTPDELDGLTRGVPVTRDDSTTGSSLYIYPPQDD